MRGTMQSTLTLRQRPAISMTPQLSQAIRLLQLSNQVLRLEIEAELAQNPFLEVATDSELNSKTYDIIDVNSTEENVYINHNAENTNNIGNNEIFYDTPSITRHHYHDQEIEDIFKNHPMEVTLKQHLLWQLNTQTFTARERLLGGIIIESINDEGYLVAELDEIQDNFTQLYPDQEKFKISEIENILYKIQHFDPLGVGARNLIECLCLQLTAAVETHVDPCQKSQNKNLSPLLREALSAVQYLEMIAKGDFQALKKKLKWDDTMLQSVLKVLRSLNPKPGLSWVGQFHIPEFVVPDLVVKKKNKNFVVKLNMANIPNIKLNHDYIEWMNRVDTLLNPSNIKNLKNLKEQSQNAKNFIHAITTRNQTLYNVAKAIVEKQQMFFAKGSEYLVPLKLAEISKECGLHESTVSRVTTEKFVDTPQGLFELKYFFSHALGKTNNISAKSIHALMKKFFENENKTHPLKDEEITQLLLQKGIKITRRTVSKYREKMKIPSSSHRLSSYLLNQAAK